METNISTSRVLKWAFIIGIIVVLNLLFGVGIALFYEKPEWDDFCGRKDSVVETLDTKESCLEVGGQWAEGGFSRTEDYPIIEIERISPDRGKSYCNEFFTCQQTYDDAREDYEQAVFIILVVLGLVAIVGGLLTKKWEVVSNGLSLGGVLSLIIASVRYWSSAPDIVRFLILVVALAVLIWFGVKKFKR